MRKLLLLLSVLSVSLFAQKPGYYNGTSGLEGDSLKAVLHEIINDHIDLGYSQSKYILNYAQEDPSNTSNLIQFYTGKSLSKESWGTGGNQHNREHIWAKSHGDFSDKRPMDGDAHNLHAADASVNIQRNNFDFDTVIGGTYIEEADAYYGGGAFMPADREKGEVARTLMYMAVRYEGTNGEMDFELADKVGTYPDPLHGKLSTLIAWNNAFPPTDFERRRNDRVEQSQGNRNPFTDNPEWANLIWGDAALPDVWIDNVSITPEYVHKDDNITIRAEVLTNLGQLPGATLYYGTERNADTYSVVMTGQGELTATMDLSSFSSSSQVFYKIKAESGDSLAGTFYLAPEEQLVSMSAVQGTGSSSPLAGQTVAIGGIVTANYDNTFTMQSAGARNAMTVYSDWRGKVGDSVVVKGKVYEYSGLTEISPATMVYSYGHKGEYVPDTISISDLNESYESSLVAIKNVNFIDGGGVFDQNSGTYVISDGENQANVFVRYDSRLCGHPIPNGTVTIKATYSEYSGAYQLLVENIDWFTVVPDYTAPSIVNVESIDKDWVYIYFNETITPDCANDINNFSFNNGLEIIGAYHYPPNKAILMVSNLEMKEYTATVKNIEDLSGNILAVDSFTFRSEHENPSAALESNDEDRLLIYPIPVNNGSMTISAQENIQSITIYTISGQRIVSETNIEAREKKLDLSQLVMGNYVLEVAFDDRRINRIFTVE